MSVVTNVLGAIFRNIKRKLKSIRLPGSKKDENAPNIPSTWRKANSKQAEERIAAGQSPVTVQKQQPVDNIYSPKKLKIKIPRLLAAKRLMAVVLMFCNVVISQFILGAADPASKIMMLLFVGNAFICADYIWKTRNKASFTRVLPIVQQESDAEAEEQE